MARKMIHTWSSPWTSSVAIESRALGMLGAGEHEVRFVPARPLAPGVYWLRLELASGRAINRRCLVR